VIKVEKNPQTPESAIAAVRALGLDERAFQQDQGEWCVVRLAAYWERRAIEKFLEAGGKQNDWLSFLSGLIRLPESVTEVDRLWDAHNQEGVYMYRPSKIRLSA